MNRGPCSFVLYAQDIENNTLSSNSAAGHWLDLPNQAELQIKCRHISSVSGIRMGVNTSTASLFDIEYETETLRSSTSSTSGPYIREGHGGRITGNSIISESTIGGTIPIHIDQADELICYEVNDIYSSNTQQPSILIQGETGAAGSGVDFCLRSTRVVGNTIIGATALNQPETGVITVRNTGESYFHVDQIINENIAHPEGGFAFYVSGDETCEVHLYDSHIRSDGSIAMGLEHSQGVSGSTGAVASGSRIFMHGSFTILGQTGNSEFNTDSATIATIQRANKTANLINLGKIKANTPFESATPKDTPVLIPIVNPSGAIDINSQYTNIPQIP